MILVRHGQTEFNLLNLKSKSKDDYIVAGQLDSPLTDFGHEQARVTGRKLATTPGINIQRAVSSDLNRAVDTAKIILKELSYSVRLEVNSQLRERHVGAFEGKIIKNLKQVYPQYFFDPRLTNWLADFEQKAPGGENFTDVTNRVGPFLQDLLEHETRDILIVSHIRTICCMIGFLLGLPNNETVRLQIPNGEPIIMECDGKRKILCAPTLDQLRVSNS